MSGPRSLALLVYLAASAWVLVATLTRPEWNFDAVGYVGAAMSGTPAEVQQQAYRSIAEAAPAPQAQAISSASDYRRRLSTDAEAFVAELPVYRFKWGYVALVRAAAGLGLSAAHATHWISTAAWGVLALALLGWLLRKQASPLVVLAAALLVMAPPLFELAALSTPDMLVVSLMALGAATVIEDCARWRAFGLASLCLCGLARPDAAMNAVVMLAALAASERAYRRMAAIGLVALVVLAGGAALASDPAQVAAAIGRYFTSRAYADASAQSGLAAYLNALAVGLRGTMIFHPSVIALWAAGGLAAWAGLGGPVHRRLRVVLIAAWAILPLRFLLFPDRSDRFYAGTYAVTGFALLVALEAARRRPIHPG